MLAALARSDRVKGDVVAEMVEPAGSAVRVLLRPEDERIFRLPDGSDELVGVLTADEVALALTWADDWVRRELRFVTVFDSEYPDQLRWIYNRPPLLFVKGSLDLTMTEQSISIVGSREASDLGTRRARKLANELAEAHYAVISGLARGIDTAAHAATLASGGLTVAVLGTGVDQTYPPENAVLAREIVTSGGALLSQFIPDQRPTRWSFPLRNVTMSGLSMATVVVEASATSGARQQATRALEHGRPVFLMASLVDTHEWARQYVEQGKNGVRAVVIDSTTDVVDRLEARIDLEAVVAG